MIKSVWIALAIAALLFACGKKEEPTPSGKPETAAHQAMEQAHEEMEKTHQAMEQAHEQMKETHQEVKEIHEETKAATRTANLELGEKIYQQSCISCHGAGIAGAPRTGDAADWEGRIAKGMDTLVENAVQGYQGEAGYMPPKGGSVSLSREEVVAAVAYMVDQSR